MNNRLIIDTQSATLLLNFEGELTLYTLSKYQKKISKQSQENIKSITINLENLSFLDTAGAIFLEDLVESFSRKKVETTILCSEQRFLDTLELVKTQKEKSHTIKEKPTSSSLEKLGESTVENYYGFMGFMAFIGQLFFTKLSYFKYFKNFRYKEIAFEINESAIKALGIIALTSFLIGVVVAYQSAYQLKIYGANIFIVDMLGISILRELAPLMTAIVIAGRSGSAFTAQIGAMKITQELDAMRTMGFDPYVFLVMPRILALMLMMPILIFVADIMGIVGGMIVASVDLNITVDLFMDRFNEVVAAKHFFIGILKGPFFAFLIATIGIYRGLMVKDDTQSIGFNTTKSVVESIFAVIVCDAVFSILFTNLGI